ncbi:MAG: phosphopyruvate hydratase [Desulfobacteraceae bacterium]|nr:phosphopyruvate hydratase [Desulfobacteraceae bacterium]
MARIEKVESMEILDSRGNPTLRVSVTTESGVAGIAAVPSGASTGEREACELRDGDPQRFKGKGVLRACANVEGEIQDALRGMDCRDLGAIDKIMLELDGTKNKERLGANAILGVSLAALNAGARCSDLPLYRYLGGAGADLLPVPMLNILNGGAHSDNNVDFQEYMLVPAGLPTFAEAMRCAAEVYQTLKELLHKSGRSTAIGDEGGFAPNLADNEEPLKLIIEAVERSGYRPGEEVFIAIDLAASNFCKEGQYFLTSLGESLTPYDLIGYLEHLVAAYPIICIEDGLDENNWAAWPALHTRLGGKIQITADDLTVTNTELIKRGISEHCFNSVLIKLNQIGSVSETLAAIEMTQKAGFTAMISHRSGETEDTSIADLCVGRLTGMIKTGAPCRSERLAKYNRLMQIERELGKAARYAGKGAYCSIGR